MLHAHGFSKSCTLLAVLCSKFGDRKMELEQREDGKKKNKQNHGSSYPFPRLCSSGRLEAHTLVNPSTDKFRDVQKSVNPNFLYVQGELHGDEGRIGSVVWPDKDMSDPTEFSSLFGSSLPTIVYLEVPNSGEIAKALHSKGIPYVIYWNSDFSSYSACHFCQALLSVLQSSCSHAWDAFQLAHASFRLYCGRDNNDKFNGKIGPCLLGDAPKIILPSPEKPPSEEKGEREEENSMDNLPTLKIYDEYVDMKFLICGSPCTIDKGLQSSLEDGLNALLAIEIRGSKLHSRVSATPPPLQAGTFSRGVITMRCDITTCSSAHISLLLSGSAQTCFDDQLLENHIKKELTENTQLVHASLGLEEDIHHGFSDPRKSSSIACGSSVLQVCMKLPTWASQVLKQLAPEVSYRSFVSLGVASIHGLSVASFEKEDAQRLLFFCTEPKNDECVLQNHNPQSLPVWLQPAAPTRKRSLSDRELKSNTSVMMNVKSRNGFEGQKQPSIKPSKKRPKLSAMNPVPRVRQCVMLPFPKSHHDLSANDGKHMKSNLPVVSSVRYTQPAPVTTHKKASSHSFRAHQMISLNPLPFKKHGCDRPPIQICSEEEFLMDVMEFLILRGHNRHVPQGGLSEFPDAVLNAKRLDLYNLYREVVTRGGFHVGNGINWKGQVFSKMRNHTVTNKMTGVGNTLKRHYETYLLEYELAHEDVDGECCFGYQAQPQYGMGFGMQYPTPTPFYSYPPKPQNPFDIPNEPSLVHASSFPSMVPMQAALPTIANPSGFLRSSSLGDMHSQWRPQQQLPGGYMPQVQANMNQQTSLGSQVVGDVGHQTFFSSVRGVDPNMNVGYPQHGSGSYNSFAPPSSRNPFG